MRFCNTICYVLMFCTILFSSVIGSGSNEVCSSFGNYDEDASGIDANSHRSRKEIVKGITENSVKLQAVLTKYPDIKGEILVLIGINSCGLIDTCDILETEITNTLFLQEMLDSISTFQFNAVDRADDYVLIEYPFKFVQRKQLKSINN